MTTQGDSSDIVIVTTTTVACEGSADHGGHPRVFLKLDGETHEAECPYCSRVFQLDPNAKVSAAH